MNRHPLVLATVALALGLITPAFQPTARAALADVATTPLGVNISNGKPNVMFILDDSGSMDTEYMPDDINGMGVYGARSAQCNGIAYNPSVTYALPVYANGTKYPSATYTAALSDGYNTLSPTVDLSTDLTYRYYYVYTGSQTALDWRYNTDGSRQSTTFATECNTAAGAGNSVFTRVDTTTLTTAQKQNYANWYSYYHKRYLTMRTAVGNAFASLDANYRVGFTTISDTSISSANFLDTKDFDATQKNSFYSLLYSVAPNGWTPLRESLSKVGRYYAKAISGQTYDPMANSATDPALNSCRRNYAILSTDGYWNQSAGVQLDGSSALGNQDGTEVRPMKDGASIIATTTTDTTQTDQRTSSGSANAYTIQSRQVTDTHTCTYYDPWDVLHWFARSGKETTRYEQRRTGTTPSSRVLVEDVTSGSRNVVVKNNGLETSNTTTALPTTTSTVSDTVTATGSINWSSWSTFGGTSVTAACGTATGSTGSSTSSASTVTPAPAPTWTGTQTTSNAAGTPTARPTPPTRPSVATPTPSRTWPSTTTRRTFAPTSPITWPSRPVRWTRRPTSISPPSPWAWVSRAS